MKTFLIIAIIIVAFIIYKRYFSEINESNEEFVNAVLKNLEINKNKSNDKKVKHKEKIRTFPAKVNGKVSFTYHIGYDPSIDMVWLEEYGELEFFVSSDLFDEINIEEDNSYSFTIIEKEDNNLWVTSGEKL